MSAPDFSTDAESVVGLIMRADESNRQSSIVLVRVMLEYAFALGLQASVNPTPSPYPVGDKITIETTGTASATFNVDRSEL